jgi:hypothetical protein
LIGRKNDYELHSSCKLNSSISLGGFKRDAGATQNPLDVHARDWPDTFRSPADNNRVLLVRNGGRNELHYIVSDLGTTFGKTGAQRSPIALFKSIKGSRNEPDDYVEDEFIDEIEGNMVRLDYSGKNSNIMRDITIAANAFGVPSSCAKALSFVSEIVVFLVAGLAAKRIVQTGVHRLHVQTIAFVVHVEFPGTHATADFMPGLVRHDRPGNEPVLLILIDIRTKCCHKPSK